MKFTFLARNVLILGLVLAATTGCSKHEEAPAPNTAPQAADAEKNLRAASDQFYSALNAMFVGDMAPMNAIWSHRDDVTDMGPFGGRLEGWTAVGAEFKKEADMKLGGRVVSKDLLVRVGGDMGYTVCVEEGENMSVDGKSVVVSHRATSIYRLENGQWKMVQHHTDISPQLETAIGIAH